MHHLFLLKIKLLHVKLLQKEKIEISHVGEHSNFFPQMKVMNMNKQCV
jgi:hypothetical protein